MRLSIVASKNSKSFRMIKSTYENKKNTSKIVENLGTLAELKEKLNLSTEEEVVAWAQRYVKEATIEEKEKHRQIIVSYSPTKQIPYDEQRMYNGGYLFLQKIYKELGLPKICREISKNYKFTYDLDSILSRLVYSRIIFPASKLATMELSKKFIQEPKFELNHIYRGLEVICKESDFIQSELYKNSLKISKRNSGVLYYDLTNFFFELEEADESEGLRQYGVSKENRPNPIVQMGLMLDGDGIPLAFCIERGNKNEQSTLKPLEQQIIKDFELSKFVVCTDAGLSSQENRKFNSKDDRSFITTQSLKKMKKHIKDWATSPMGWKLTSETNSNYDISKFDDLEETHPKIYNTLKEKTFYKERWINENGFEQRLIVTYSLKYRDYHKHIRSQQIERALKVIEKNPAKFKANRTTDFKRFIKQTNICEDGEVAKKTLTYLDELRISEESRFDGLYAVCTNLTDSTQDIIKVNNRRWEIEESFRIMKSEFKARPVHLSRDDRIIAHFTTCFIALMIFRLLERKLQHNFTANEIFSSLRDFNFEKIPADGFRPLYTRTLLTDSLHDAFAFRTDFQINTNRMLKLIF